MLLGGLLVLLQLFLLMLAYGLMMISEARETLYILCLLLQLLHYVR